MLRIHFTDRDLGRVQVADEPDPLWESVLSLHRLGSPGVVANWRDQAVDRLRAADAGGLVRLLRTLVPQTGYFPDFLTPAAAAAGLSEGLDAVLATPGDRLRADLAHFARHRRPTAWERRLAAGDRDALRTLTDGLDTWYRMVIEPEWTSVHERIAADRARRARTVLRGGTEALLRSLRPVFRWDPPVLSADYPFAEMDVHLRGRGLRLIPSYFCQGMPVVLVDPELPQVAVYPIEHAPDLPPRRAHALAALLGGTRGRVLAALRTPAATSELAQRLDLSTSSASEHTSVLRDAGLVVSVRDGQRVVHSLTPLGMALCRGS